MIIQLFAKRMGSGVSVQNFDDLTPTEKRQLSKFIQEKYKALKLDQSLNESAMMLQLSEY